MIRTHCFKGHELTPENTYTYGEVRRCKTCTKAGIDRRRKTPTGRATDKRGYIRRKHHLTPEEYYRKLSSQNNLCGLCHKPFYGEDLDKGSPVLDHSHVDGSQRDFIHRECNTALGLLKEDPEICIAAAEYIVKWKGSV